MTSSGDEFVSAINAMFDSDLSLGVTRHVVTTQPSSRSIARLKFTKCSSRSLENFNPVSVL